MKIRRLHIEGYKNLINTSVAFESDEMPYAIIGNNGTGKSNLIEAILHIFIGLYFNKKANFNYTLSYVVRNQQVDIINKPKIGFLRIEIDGYRISSKAFKETIREFRDPPFPDLIFCYYSGPCDRTKRLINRYNRSYNRILKKRDHHLERQFVFSDVVQAEWCLLGLFAHGYYELLEKLRLTNIDRFRLSLVPPETFDDYVDDPKFWGIEGAFRDFLADLDNAAIDMNERPGFGSNLRDLRLRVYRFDEEGLMRIGRALEGRGTNFLSMMQVLAGRKMLRKVEFFLETSMSDDAIQMDDLSEGEKQLLCVIGGLKLSNQAESLVLLDEPDTHLNPSWSWEYDSLLEYALNEDQQDDSMVLIATHDPVIISGMTREQILISQIRENNLVYSRPLKDPRGQGIANVLTSSEYFGLPSSLDKKTQALMDERLKLAMMRRQLSQDERDRLRYLNELLDYLGFNISTRDPEFAAYLETKYRQRDQR